VPGRSREWLKLNCAWEQEFVIRGYTEPGGVLVGYYEGRRLRYAGKV